MTNTTSRLFTSVVLFLTLAGSTAFAFTQPNENLTPGTTCSESNANFSEYRYPAHVAYCSRNVSNEEKIKVAADYGIPRADWSKYEFDHLIPLAAGGSDDASNIWPQPLDEAHLKDAVELDVYEKLKSGAIDQAQAIAEIRGWFSSLALQKAGGQ